LEKIVCLANSRKLKGRCFAGKLVEGPCAGRWIRPVSSRESHEVAHLEMQLQNGATPKLLDVVEVPFANGTVPLSHKVNAPMRRASSSRYSGCQFVVIPWVSP